MPSSLKDTIVIACPHCGTRYQVPPDAIGSGRKVSCAHCGRTWTAHRPAAPTAEDLADQVFDAEEEAMLDHAFDREAVGAGRSATPAPAPAPAHAPPAKPAGTEIPPEVLRTIAQIKAAIGPKAKHAEVKGTDTSGEATAPGGEDGDRTVVQGRFQRRQKALARALPTSRVRSAARIASLAVLAAVLAAGYLLRVPIVTALPDLAGVYAALGVKVNVVGLDFTGLATTRSRRAGEDVLTVEANIRSLDARPVHVPAVIVDLLDAGGRSLYQWSVAPRVAELEPGESIGFVAELNRPPEGATSARLSFAGFAPTPAPVTDAPAPADAEVDSHSGADTHTEAPEHHG